MVLVQTDARQFAATQPPATPNSNPAIQAILDQVIAGTLTRDQAIAQINALQSS
jgi:hypothetical protein